MARNNVTLQDLTDWATRVGVKVVVAPSSHRGTLGKMGTVVGVTRHHTGTANTARPAEDYPDYAVVKEGRAGLENSLSAYGLGRHECIYVFSEYLSWHAGTWLWNGITDGNGHFLGIEAAGIGDWTDWQRNIYPRLVASILLGVGEGVDMMPRHGEGATPAGRKTDMANEWPTFRAEVANYLAHPEQIPVSYAAGTVAPPVPSIQEDDQMIAYSTVDTRRGYLQQGLDFWWEGDGEVYDTCKQAAGGTVIQMNQRQADVLGAALWQRRAALIGDVAKVASKGAVDIDALAAAVAAKMPDADEMTAAEIKAAAKAGLIEVLTSGTGA